MRNLKAAVFIGLTFLSVDAQSQGAQRVFATASPAIVVVKTIDGRSQGSGVAYRTLTTPTLKTAVVTNCHVLRGQSSAIISRAGKRLSGSVLLCDSRRDIAIVLVDGEQPVASSRQTMLSVGERVYAIGAPQGLELSISEGIVSQLRNQPAGTAPMIQTTAAISPGSSGGGLFDSDGKLVGITTLQLREGQQLNFALPVQIVDESILATIIKSEPDTTAANQPRIESPDRKPCNWKQFYSNSSGTQYFEPCSVKTRGDFKWVVTLGDFASPMRLPDGLELWSVKGVQVFDCAMKKYHLVRIVGFSSAMGEGRTVHNQSYDLSNPNWVRIIEKPSEALFDEVCG